MLEGKAQIGNLQSQRLVAEQSERIHGISDSNLR